VRTTWENRFVQDDAGGRWESREVREPAGTQTVTTDGNGDAVISFTPDKGGAYLVLARTRDAGGREARASLYVWVYGGDALWLRENNDRINLIADKGEYRPGETATILIPSPFTGPHWALLTVERGGVLSHEVRQVSGGSLVYQLPITAEHAPNIFVSAVLFAPPDSNGAPADYKVGILPLSVTPVLQTLQVAVTTTTPQAAPGDTVQFEVRVTDVTGAPVAAELSLDLVDKAVLSLQPREPDAIVQAFYGRRPLGVFTGRRAVGRRRAIRAVAGRGATQCAAGRGRGWTGGCRTDGRGSADRSTGSSNACARRGCRTRAGADHS
jgi:Large extracellular alpha-helical protein